MKFKSLLMAMLVPTVFAGLALSASDRSDLNDRVDAAERVVREIMKTPDKGIPDSVVRHATCIAVIPSVVKGAFIVGASYGQGVVTCRTHNGWSAPVFIRLAGGSVGFQIGGQATDLILVAVNQKGLQHLLRSKSKIGGDAAASAGPVGRNASASTDATFRAELLSYSRSRGVFAGVDLNGAVVSQNTEDTDKYYGGHSESFSRILHGGVPVPSGARNFVATIAHYFHETRA